MVEIKENAITASEFISIWNAVEWGGDLRIERIEMALKNSICTFGIYIDETIIGMGRLLGDGAMSFYLKDFAILPEFQKNGYGTELLIYILKYIKTKTLYGGSLELISSKGREEFYQKFGFEIRPSEYDGAGMFLHIPAENND